MDISKYTEDTSKNTSRWQQIEEFFRINFTDGETPDLDTILFLIGVQELGQGKKKFKKDDKLNLLHIAVCRVLEPFGFYRFDGQDPDGWPHCLRKKENRCHLRQCEVSYTVVDLICIH